MSSLRLSFLAHPKSPSLTQPRSTPSQTRLLNLPRCALSVISDPTHLKTSASENDSRHLPAENSRTIMELSSVRTLSTISNGGWPLGLGVEFAVDSQGTPVLCLNDSHTGFFGDDLRASFHVQKVGTGSSVFTMEQVTRNLMEMGFEPALVHETVKQVCPSMEASVDYLLNNSRGVMHVSLKSPMCFNAGQNSLKAGSSVSTLSAGKMQKTSIYKYEYTGRVCRCFIQLITLLTSLSLLCL